MCLKNSFILINSLKIWFTIDVKKNAIIENYVPKTKVEIEDKTRVVSILNETRHILLDYYLDPNTIAELQKRCQRDDADSILKKYSEDGNSIDEIMDQIEVLKNAKSIAGRNYC